MTELMIAADLVAGENDKRAAALKSDYEALGAHLSRRGIDIDDVTKKVAEFFVAVPSWGVGTGAPALPAFRVRASRAAFSTSWKTAPSSSSSPVRRRPSPSIFRGTRPISANSR